MTPWQRRQSSVFWLSLLLFLLHLFSNDTTASTVVPTLNQLSGDDIRRILGFVSSKDRTRLINAFPVYAKFIRPQLFLDRFRLGAINEALDRSMPERFILELYGLLSENEVAFITRRAVNEWLITAAEINHHYRLIQCLLRIDYPTVIQLIVYPVRRAIVSQNTAHLSLLKSIRAELTPVIQRESNELESTRQQLREHGKRWLFQSISIPSVEAARRVFWLLSQGVDVNSLHFHQRTPLIWAAARKDPLRENVIVELLKFGPDVNATDKSGNSALLLTQDYKTISLLLRHGAEPNQENSNGETALILASRRGDYKSIGLLLSFGALPDGFSLWGDSALSAASAKGCINCVDLLISAGADVNRQNHEGSTALIEASRAGRLTVVKMLLDRGGADRTLRDLKGMTALDYAESSGRQDIVQCLEPINVFVC